MRRISLHSEKDWIRTKQQTKDLSEYGVCVELGSAYIRQKRLWKVSLKSVSVMKAYGSGWKTRVEFEVNISVT